eukprot:15465134-Alexandrium_andersonii.AAC.1
MAEALDVWTAVEAGRTHEDDWELAQHDSPSGYTMQFAHQLKGGLGEFFICRYPPVPSWRGTATGRTP